MAVDPSTKSNSEKRKHSRNVTPIIPVLPLLASDKKWRKPSLPVNNVALPVELIQPAEPRVSAHLSPSSEEEAEPEETVDTETRNEKPVESLTPVETEPTNGRLDEQIIENGPTDAVVEIETPETDNIGDLPESLLTEAHVNGIQTRSRSSTLIAHEVGELAESSLTSQPNDSPQPHASTEDTSAPGKQAPAESARVLLSEADTQGSDPDNNSIQRSNTTGLTDYGSTADESNLETVILESQPPARLSKIPHRQSEVAPELLSNGYSPNSSRAGKPPHQANASSSSQLPRLPTLQEHLLFLATAKQACDVVIQLNQPDRSYRPSAHNVHSLFLMRSPRLAALLPEFDPTTPTKILNLFPVRNIFPHAFDAALRFFYSDQTLTAEALLSPQILRDKQAKMHSLDYIMSYWIAGIELGLDPIKTRAYEFVQQIVGWDTVEFVVKEIQGLRLAEEILSNNHDKLEIRGIADTLLSLVVQLFVEGLNMDDFNLDPNAKVTAFPSRLSHLENRPNNPALSAMVFGSLPAQTMPPSSVESVASAILLNMDFKDLQLLATELISWHGTAAQNILLYVVHLREEKRDQIVTNSAISNKDRLSHSAAWDLAGWKEFLHEGRLQRERVGFLLPNPNR